MKLYNINKLLQIIFFLNGFGLNRVWNHLKLHQTVWCSFGFGFWKSEKNWTVWFPVWQKVPQTEPNQTSPTLVQSNHWKLQRNQGWIQLLLEIQSSWPKAAPKRSPNTPKPWRSQKTAKHFANCRAAVSTLNCAFFFWFIFFYILSVRLFEIYLDYELEYTAKSHGHMC